VQRVEYLKRMGKLQPERPKQSKRGPKKKSLLSQERLSKREQKLIDECKLSIQTLRENKQLENAVRQDEQCTGEK